MLVDVNEEQNRKIKLVKLVKNFRTKQEAIIFLVDNYNVSPLLSSLNVDGDDK